MRTIGGGGAGGVLTTRGVGFLIPQYNEGDAVVGGMPRALWRVLLYQILRHEVQHVLYDNAIAGGRPAPANLSAGCTRSTPIPGTAHGTVDGELSELNAILSEFIIAYRAIPAGARRGNQMYDNLYSRWFPVEIRNRDESICGALTALRSVPGCSCADVDKHVTDTYNFVTSSWTAAERSALNTELVKPRWKLYWPISP